MRQLIRRIVFKVFDLVFRFMLSVMSEETRFKQFSKYSFQILSWHYYTPIPDQKDLQYLRDTELVGVNLNTAAALELIDQVVTPYKAEFNAFPLQPTADALQFNLINGTHMAIDGNLYYGLIRRYQPRRIVEIGSGNSTLLAAAAIRRNVAEGKPKSELYAIEPYPSDKLARIPELTELISKRVQDVPLSFFQNLQSGDILFIDSTHVFRPGGDIWWEYCEILPRLAPGVMVHIHDISLPKPYPQVYIDNGWYWNEQWILQTFLTFNTRFEVLWPGNYLMVNHPDRMKTAFTPEYEQMRAAFPSSEPTSFWMRVREDKGAPSV